MRRCGWGATIRSRSGDLNLRSRCVAPISSRACLCGVVLSGLSGWGSSARAPGRGSRAGHRHRLAHTTAHFDSASPIVSVTEEPSNAPGQHRRNALNTLPQFVPSYTTTSTTPNDGQANVDLRGLGTTHAGPAGRNAVDTG